MMKSTDKYAVVVMGASAGGIQTLSNILARLNSEFQLPILIVQHISPDQMDVFTKSLMPGCPLQICEAEDKISVRPGCIYFAPPNYHMLLDGDGTVSLSVDERIHYSRPSIDVLFESAAYVLGDKCVGILLTGANEDGSEGLCKIRDEGGLTAVQDPRTASNPYMPEAALKQCDGHQVLSVDEIAELLNSLSSC